MRSAPIKTKEQQTATWDDASGQEMMVRQSPMLRNACAGTAERGIVRQGPAMAQFLRNYSAIIADGRRPAV